MEDLDINRLCYLIVKRNAINRQRLAEYRKLRKLKTQRRDEIKKRWDTLRHHCYTEHTFAENAYEDQRVQEHFLKHFKIGKQLNRERHTVEGRLFKCQDDIAELTLQMKPILKYHNLKTFHEGDNQSTRLIFKDSQQPTLKLADIKRNAEWYLIERDILS